MCRVSLRTLPRCSVPRLTPGGWGGGSSYSTGEPRKANELCGRGETDIQRRGRSDWNCPEWAIVSVANEMDGRLVSEKEKNGGCHALFITILGRKVVYYQNP